MFDPIEPEAILLRLLRPAQMEDPRALREAGRVAQERGDTQSALVCFQRASALGYTPAMFDAAKLLLDRNDSSGAIEYLHEAYKHGESGGAWSIGQIIRTERADPETATHWYKAAADMGNEHGMTSYGAMMIEAGNFEEARIWLMKAFQKGHPMAMHNLGVLEECEGNYESARDWYQKAVEAGEELAVGHPERIDEEYLSAASYVAASSVDQNSLSSVRFCSNCGSPAEPKNRFCPQCGTQY